MEVEQINELVRQSADLQERILSLHQIIKSAYSKYLAELESVNLPPIQYAQVVHQLINDKTSKPSFGQFVSPATEMVISLLLSNASYSVESTDFDVLNTTCLELIKLHEHRVCLMQTIAAEMMRIVPNVAALVGTTIASLLLVSAGSLENLSKIPSCNLQLIGKSSSTVEGNSYLAQNVVARISTTAESKAFTIKTNQLSHSGYLGDSQFVKEQPTDFQRKALRLLAAKCAICARLDLFKEFPDGSKGVELRNEIEEKIAKAQEPPPYKQQKPLPAPIDVAKKRRGGRRARKQKQLLAQTEVRRLQNKVAFGQPEKEIIVGDDIEGLGMLKEATKLIHIPNGQLRDSIKKAASKNKIFSSFASETQSVNVAVEPQVKSDKKYKWF